METKKAEPGTVSHGTLRVVDLVPTFWDKLVELESTLELDIGDHAMHELILAVDSDSDLTDEELEHAQQLLEVLHAAMEEHAPEGHYFGANEGDGSDFGYWLDTDAYGECNSCGVVLPHEELYPVIEELYQGYIAQDGWLCHKHYLPER